MASQGGRRRGGADAGCDRPRLLAEDGLGAAALAWRSSSRFPSGAQVMVDGQVMGLTPVTATLPSGTHRVDFKLPRQDTHDRRGRPQGGKASELVDWSPRTVGRLQVNSEPAGARVLVDNVPRGVTPLTLDDVTIRNAYGGLCRAAPVR